MTNQQYISVLVCPECSQQLQEQEDGTWRCFELQGVPGNQKPVGCKRIFAVTLEGYLEETPRSMVLRRYQTATDAKEASLQLKAKRAEQEQWVRDTWARSTLLGAMGGKAEIIRPQSADNVTEPYDDGERPPIDSDDMG